MQNVRLTQEGFSTMAIFRTSLNTISYGGVAQEMRKNCYRKNNNMNKIETHPFTPFLPGNAKLLMLGTFPPAPKRWCMEFYYPNFTNDMWRIIGICFFNDKHHFVDQAAKTYKLKDIVNFLNEHGIAMYDTCTKICRTKNTASDKDLEVVEQTDLDTMLRQLPQCQAVVTAGQLATSLFCTHYSIAEPKVGDYSKFTLDNRTLRLYRMPSSSRAYPMKTELKAESYSKVFKWLWP